MKDQVFIELSRIKLRWIFLGVGPLLIFFLIFGLKNSLPFVSCIHCCKALT